MAVRDYGRASGSMTIGIPVVHHATVDLKGKIYEYVFKHPVSHVFDLHISNYSMANGKNI